MVFIRFPALLPFLVLAAFSPGAASAQEETAVAPPAAECQPVVRLFDRQICRAEVALDPEIVAAMRETAARTQTKEERQALEESIRNYEHKQIAALVWETGLQAKYGEQALEASEEEVDAYISAQKEAVGKKYSYGTEIFEKISVMLQENTYKPRDERRLLEIAMETRSAQYLDELQKKMIFDENPAAQEKLREKARQAIETWKGKKLLYEDYGGDVVYQEEGPEPVEAYQKFFAYMRDEGGLKITDPAYKDTFGDMATYFSMDHKVIPEAQQSMVEEYFTAPHSVFAVETIERMYRENLAEIQAIEPTGKKDLPPEKGGTDGKEVETP